MKEHGTNRGREHAAGTRQTPDEPERVLLAVLGIVMAAAALWMCWFMLTSDQRPSPSEADHALGCDPGIPYRAYRSFTLYRNKPDAYWWFPFISTVAVPSGQVLIEDDVVLCAHERNSRWSSWSMWIRITGDRGPGWIDAGPYDSIDHMLNEERHRLQAEGRRAG